METDLGAGGRGFESLRPDNNLQRVGRCARRAGTTGALLAVVVWMCGCAALPVQDGPQDGAIHLAPGGSDCTLAGLHKRSGAVFLPVQGEVATMRPLELWVILLAGEPARVAGEERIQGGIGRWSAPVYFPFSYRADGATDLPAGPYFVEVRGEDRGASWVSNRCRVELVIEDDEHEGLD